MPNSVQLDNPWPLQRVPLDATPHKVSFYPEARLYMLLVSKDGPHKQWLEAEEGGDMHAAYSYALAKESAKIKSQEFGFEVWANYFVKYPSDTLPSWPAPLQATEFWP